MPVSERLRLILTLKRILIQCLLFDEMDMFLLFFARLYQVERSRYLYRGGGERTPQQHQLRDILYSMENAAQFKQALRMDIDTFEYILSRIIVHPIFHNNSGHPQLDPRYQLMVTLMKFGMSGNERSRDHLARVFGIAHGSSINYVRRVIIALLSLKSEFISWPDAARRREISAYFDANYNFPGVIGLMDGTYINLEQQPAPRMNPSAYFNRKGKSSLNVLIVCDERKKIIYATIGFPGSAHDSAVYSSSRLSQHPEIFFDDGQYLLADAGYPCTAHSIVPFKRSASFHRDPDKPRFNRHLSTARVGIEHVNGLLKARFQSLTNVRVHLNNDDDHRFLCDYIHTIFIVHNMITVFNAEDQWEVEAFEEERFPEGGNPPPPNLDQACGTRRREEIMQIMRNRNIL